MKMCPEAKIDDGLLDITYVQNVAPDKVPELLQALALGGKQEDDLSESIKTMRVSWLKVPFFTHLFALSRSLVSLACLLAHSCMHLATDSCIQLLTQSARQSTLPALHHLCTAFHHVQVTNCEHSTIHCQGNFLAA